jgi:class 3 adenylate cyclase
MIAPYIARSITGILYPSLLDCSQVGDAYVAVTGCPNPNDRHALVMVRFAAACLAKFHELTHKLEHSLGPDTCDLGLRVGLHSGPVTVSAGGQCWIVDPPP